MREELTKVLTARYPALYGQQFAFEHHDGWFSLIDVLSEALVAGAEVAGRPPPRASQVKEKFGTLRWYFGGDAYDPRKLSDFRVGAIDLAEEMSGWICEKTGRPGRLGSRAGWWATRAPGLDGIEPKGDGLFKGGRMGVPPLGFAAAEMRAWRADALREGAVVDVPPGWRDIADGVLCVLSETRAFPTDRPDGGPQVYAERICVRDGALRVEHTGGAYADGVVAAAAALSRRTDVMEGGLL